MCRCPSSPCRGKSPLEWQFVQRGMPKHRDDSFEGSYRCSVAACHASRRMLIFIFALPRRGAPQKLSRSHCATQKAAIREISLNLIFHNCTFSKKVLDTFGNDGFRGKQDVAMVRCPRNRTGLLIRFTAIIATVLVQGPGCNLIGERRNENGNSIVGRSQFGNSFPQIMKSWIVRMFKRIVRMFHRVPSSAGADAWLKMSATK